MTRRFCKKCRRPFHPRARPAPMTWSELQGEIVCNDCQRGLWDKYHPELTHKSKYYQQVLKVNSNKE